MNDATASRVSTWIGIATTFALVVASYVTLREAVANGRINDEKHDKAIEKHGERIATIERDSTLVVRMTALEGVVAAQNEQIRLLREEIARWRRNR